MASDFGRRWLRSIREAFAKGQHDKPQADEDGGVPPEVPAPVNEYDGQPDFSLAFLVVSLIFAVLLLLTRS